MALGDVIARLAVSLSLNTAAFEKGSRKAKQEVTGLQGHMTKAAKAIGGALAGMLAWDTVRAWGDATKAAIDFAGSLGETAQQLGVTTDELQEYRYVASQTGIEQAAMDKALQKTTRTLGELATPTKAQAAALKELGISAKSLEGLGTGDFIQLLGDKFKGLTAAQQAALGAQLGLGRGFQTLIPLLNEGAAGIAKMREEAHKLGIVISEEAIKNADVNADLLTTYEKIAEAQKNATLTLPENVRAYMEYRKAVTDFQVGLYKAISGVVAFGDAWDETIRDAGRRHGVQEFFRNFNEAASAWAKNTHDIIVAVPGYIRDMTVSIGRLITGTLGKIWDGALAKIRAVGSGFQWLYDVVVGHSYVPDMIDGIAAEMARLDSVMVAQAGRATSATADKFRDLRDTLDRLFPEIGKADAFNAELAGIENNSKLTDAQKDEAAQRLWREFSSGSPFGSGSKTAPDFGNMGGPLVDGIGATEDAIVSLTERAKVGTVAIAKSFADMAQNTLDSLGKLTSAIKGGGFWDILGAVVGLGVQLGQAGVFGKNVAGFLNKVPAHAMGTSFAPGGLSLVGERGPELVNLPRGSKVIPNSKIGGVTNNYYTLPSEEFWGRINAGHAQAAQAGARGGEARIAYKQSRRVA